MCGIAGIFHFNRQRSVDCRFLKQMTDSLKHRGPDAEGVWVNKNIGFGHRRLSIIDLYTGDQPMLNANKSIAIVFNGEIYNYVELKKELELLGHVFRTNSDTEVIIEAYSEWGVECQSKFNGCWSFALWDDSMKQLILSVDRFGEKPLHYSLHDDSIIFASEIKALFANGIPKHADLQFLELYLVLGNIPTPNTFFKNIYKLKPGHYLTINQYGIKESKYWDIPQVPEEEMLSDRPVVYETFDYLLRDSVKIRMRSDVPFGAFLSGGLDSSSIVAIMSERSTIPVETFTMKFNEAGFDESPLAALVANKFRTHHHVHTITPESFENALDTIVFHYDEPFGDSSAIPTGYVSDYASKHVKMVLTGDGGDEVLSGYNSYQGIKLTTTYNQLPRFVKKRIPSAGKFVAPVFSGRTRYLIDRFVNFTYFSNLAFNSRIISKAAGASLEFIRSLLPCDTPMITTQEYVTDLFHNCSFKDEFYKLMYLNFKHNLPNDYLVKVDRMTMAHALEARVPFLDYRLVELMTRVHKDVKMNGYERKSVLRNSTGKLLPPAILRANKKGFGIPIREWFKKDDLNHYLRQLANVDFGLSQAGIERIIEINKQGKADHGNFIWQLFVLSRVLSKCA